MLTLSLSPLDMNVLQIIYYTDENDKLGKPQLSIPKSVVVTEQTEQSL